MEVLNNVTKIDEGFVVSRYRQANNRPEQIDILAQLYETDIDLSRSWRSGMLLICVI